MEESGKIKETACQCDIYHETGLGEECGVMAAYDFDGGDVASSIY